MPRRTKKSKKFPSVANALAGKEVRSKKSAVESSKTVKKPKKVQLPVRISRKTGPLANLEQVRQQTREKEKNKKTEIQRKTVKEIKQPVKETVLPAIKQKNPYKSEAKTKKINKKKQPSYAKASVVRRHSFERRSAGKQVDPERIEQDKRLMMWAGVAFFMVLIFGIWIFNLKNVFKTTENTDTNNSAVQEWDKIADEFTKTLEKVKEGMAELKEVEIEEEGRNVFSETATTSDDAVIFEDDEINELKKRLEELENQIKADEEQATSTP